MAKNKSGTPQTSKGERNNVNSKITKGMRSERSEVDKITNAWKSWKKGQPTPKLIQKSLGIGPKTLYKSYFKYVALKGKDSDG
jgi:hypothetical protein